jgi:TRAP-type transport system small permease protein
VLQGPALAASAGPKFPLILEVLMRQLYGGIIAALMAVCRAGTLASFAVLIGVVTMQVLGRIPSFPSPSWTEEVARFALVYMVAFSSGIALMRSEMVNVDLLVTQLPPAVRRRIERVVDAVVLVFALSIIPGSWRYVAGSVGERARSIDIPMIVIYVIVLIIPLSLALFALARLLGIKAGGPTTSLSEVR